MAWLAQRWSDHVAAFHARPMPHPVERVVWVCDPVSPALVLGSSQPDRDVDVGACEAAGVDVVRRHSGGGAVLVEPGAVLWVDVLVPADDPLWDPDVGRSFLWLGEVWAAALKDLSLPTAVHQGPFVRNRWSDKVCFAGLGSGELTDGQGRKVLGMSQRRTRAGARFQCAVLAAWDPAPLIALLALSPEERVAAATDLADAAVGVGRVLDGLLPALLARLP